MSNGSDFVCGKNENFMQLLLNYTSGYCFAAAKLPWRTVKYGVTSLEYIPGIILYLPCDVLNFYHLLKFLYQELWLLSPFINKISLMYLTQLKSVSDHILWQTLNMKFSAPFMEYFFLSFQVAILVIWSKIQHRKQ